MCPCLSLPPGSRERAGRTRDPQHRVPARGRFPLFPLLALFLAACGSGCSPDLHETVGPANPLPNLTGRVVRAGFPVADVKVKLNRTTTDSTVNSDRTGPDGRFGFIGVGPGDWTLKTGGNQPGDFPRVSWDFVLVSDSTLESPDLDVDLHGLELVEPADGDSVAFPTFSRPIVLRWRGPDLDGYRVEARVFDAAGSAVWYSEKMHTTEVSWNGLANRGPGAGRPVPAGLYNWELRVDWNGNPEYTSAERRFLLQERTP